MQSNPQVCNATNHHQDHLDLSICFFRSLRTYFVVDHGGGYWSRSVSSAARQLSRSASTIFTREARAPPTSSPSASTATRHQGRSPNCPKCGQRPSHSRRSRFSRAKCQTLGKDGLCRVSDTRQSKTLGKG